MPKNEKSDCRVTSVRRRSSGVCLVIYLTGAGSWGKETSEWPKSELGIQSINIFCLGYRDEINSSLGKFRNARHVSELKTSRIKCGPSFAESSQSRADGDEWAGYDAVYEKRRIVLRSKLIKHLTSNCVILGGSPCLESQGFFTPARCFLLASPKLTPRSKSSATLISASTWLGISSNAFSANSFGKQTTPFRSPIR